MYRSIATLVDPSKQRDKALAIARALAETFDARVVGLKTEQGHAERLRRERLAALLPGGATSLLDAASPGSVAEDVVDASELALETRVLSGAALEALSGELGVEGAYDLAILPAHRSTDPDDAGLGALTERVLRQAHVDTLIVKDTGASAAATDWRGGSDTILVCIDGSREAYGGLEQALELARRFDKQVECVAVYDPYLHYTLFNGIVNVLTEEASRVFKFADQEKLHEEIIDTGLAKIYQAHLEVALQVARAEDMEVRITLLDGKAFSKILRHVQKTSPWLVVMGRIGVHSEEGMDVGATSENLLRSLPCDVLLSSSTFVPPVDVQAEAAIEWTETALQKMERVPSFVKGVATTAVIRWAMERGHSVITPSVINSAMGDLLPPGAAQAMGYIAEVAAKADLEHDGKTFLCPDCGYAARDYRPVACPVCKTEGARFELIDRETLTRLGDLDKGVLSEEQTFDGKRLTWTEGAKEVLRRVPSGYERRRAKARMEKTARVRGLELLTKEFAVDMVQQEMADTSYLSDKGERVDIVVEAAEKPDDEIYVEHEESPLPWTDAAWKRVARVPIGFMRDMTREKVEEFAADKGLDRVNLELCEQGIAEGRRMMAEMLGSYDQGGPSKQKVQAAAKATAAARARQPAAKKAAAEATEGTTAEAAEPMTPVWTPGAEEVKDSAVERVQAAGKFGAERAEQLARGVTEERARDKRMLQINESFMAKLGKQLGYGHPLADITAEHQFEWTPEAEARLLDVPDFCREMTRWRVEWTAVKRDLGTTITPEIMDVKYEMWGEVSDAIQEREGQGLEWAPEAMARLEKIPDFVKGQVIQSVEGNARRWELERIDSAVLDRVIDKWIETGDFHEGLFGYK